MPINAEEQNFSSKVFRPRTRFAILDELDLVFAITPWGPDSSHIELIQEKIVTYARYALQQNNSEVTKRHGRHENLSALANILRVALLSAHEEVWVSTRDYEYTSGYEVVCLKAQGHEVAWAQIGQPHLYLYRPQAKSILPLAIETDESFLWTNPNQEILAPLPNSLLGIGSSVDIRSGSIRMQSGEQLILIAHPSPGLVIPNRISTVLPPEQILLALAGSIGMCTPNSAAWLGRIEVTGLDDAPVVIESVGQDGSI